MRILIVDDDSAIALDARHKLEQFAQEPLTCEAESFEGVERPTMESLVRRLHDRILEFQPDALLLDFYFDRGETRLPFGQGALESFDALKDRLRAADVALPEVVLWTGRTREAVDRDLADVAHKPSRVMPKLMAPGLAENYYRHLLTVLRQLTVDRRARNACGMDFGHSTAMQRLRSEMANLNKVHARWASVLITGETGTGKELVARALHVGGTFVSVNCGALPEQLLEALMFGSVEGAYTGASHDTLGLVAVAAGYDLVPLKAKSGRVTRYDYFVRDGATTTRAINDGDDRRHIQWGPKHGRAPGTLFLDEIGELPLPAQAKLLRVLERTPPNDAAGPSWARSSAGWVRPLGAGFELPVRLRLIAATNRDLDAECKAKRFREDLYQRLNVVRLEVPPLRERREDIPALYATLIGRLQDEWGTTIPVNLTDPAREALLKYSWPGNVRELRTRIESAAASRESAGAELQIVIPAAAGRAPRPRFATEAADAILAGDYPWDDFMKAFSDVGDRREVFNTVLLALDAHGRRDPLVAQVATLMGASKHAVKAEFSRTGIRSSGRGLLGSFVFADSSYVAERLTARTITWADVETEYPGAGGKANKRGGAVLGLLLEKLTEDEVQDLLGLTSDQWLRLKKKYGGPPEK